MNRSLWKRLILLPAFVFSVAGSQARDAAVPQNVASLWRSFDPRAEPLDVEVVREWEAEGIVTRYLLYTVGDFEGRKPRMAAYYAFPAGQSNLPGIVQLHGGGQFAKKESVEYWASIGYAAIAINWGEKTVEGPGDPNTDWVGLAAGFLDPKHHNDVSPGEGTLHAVPHPENSSWYLYAVAARRALTLLEEQPEVDGERLGLTGHSMGGRLTVLAAIDPRVKAATPSVGGSGYLYDDIWGLPGSARRMREDLPLYRWTMGGAAYWPHIDCPVLFLGATNDFNSPTEKVVDGMSGLTHSRSRLVLAPHLNHRFTATAFAARPLWFEAHLKKNFTFPETARAELALERDDGVPVLKVYPVENPPGHRLAAVDIYYGYDRDSRVRFLRDAGAVKAGDHWEGRCPVFDLEEPLFAFANVTYDLDRSIGLPRGYEKEVTQLTVTSEYRVALPEELKAAGVGVTEKPRRLIDDFSRGYHDWYRLSEEHSEHWRFGMRKIADPAWVGPKNGKLSVEAFTALPGNELAIVMETNAWRGYTGRKPDRYVATVTLAEGHWLRVAFVPEDFVNAKGEPLADWDEITELAFTPASKAFEGDASIPKWRGKPAEFRDLRWVGGVYVSRPKPYATSDGRKAFYDSEQFQKEFQEAIEASVKLEEEE